MKLILLYGPPAAGKLTVAKELSKATGIVLLHNHMFLNDLKKIFDYEDPVRRSLEFEFKMRVVKELSKKNCDFITTGSITSVNKYYYEDLLSFAKKKGIEVCLVQLKADRKTLLNRVIHESRNEKINTVEKLEEYWSKFPENLEKFGKGEQLVIDTTNKTPEESTTQIAKHYLL